MRSHSENRTESTQRHLPGNSIESLLGSLEIRWDAITETVFDLRVWVYHKSDRFIVIFLGLTVIFKITGIWAENIQPCSLHQGFQLAEDLTQTYEGYLYTSYKYLQSEFITLHSGKLEDCSSADNQAKR